jgi:heptaprenyl diphosphate synthase
MPSISEPAALTALRTDTRLAWLAAFAVGIHLLEAALPPVLPGLKPGLANVVAVAARCLWGWATAAWITVLRILVGSFFLGTLFAPAFWLSLGGGLGALAALAAGGLLPGRGLGPVGFSLLASLAHVSGQLLVAYGLFIRHPGLLALAPLLAVGAVATGTLNGWVAQAVVRSWQGSPARDSHDQP